MVLGIIGGMGPMATVYFYKLLTEHTKADKDGDHIDAVISSRASTPDRTGFILGRSTDDPVAVMTKDAKRLESFGADILAIPCNTAHCFLPKLRAEINIPIIDMVGETAAVCAEKGCKKVGVLATDGTVRGGTYEAALNAHGITPIMPSEEDQSLVMSIIYDYVKASIMPERALFDKAVEQIKKNGADSIILACTELSILKEHFDLDGYYIDSLEVLACRAIERCGKTPVGFDFAAG